MQIDGRTADVSRPVCYSPGEVFAMDSLSIGVLLRGARVLPMLAALLATGCGAPSRGEVSGVVTYNGAPLPSGIVVFMNEGVPSQYQVASTSIGGDGRYHLPQVACGDVRISVNTPPPVGPMRGVPIPKHYADLEKSGLTYTVTAGSQTFDIKLSGPPAPPSNKGGKSLSPDDKLKQKRKEKNEPKQQGDS
jgi:hypothetical protein